MTAYGDSEMRKRLQDNTYKPKIEYPTQPIKPNSVKRLKVLDYDNPNFEDTVLQMEKATVEIKDYQKQLFAYNEQKKEYDTEYSCLTIQAEQDMIDSVFSKAEQEKYNNLISKLYYMAYESGHSSGMYEVYNTLCQMDEIIDAVEKDYAIFFKK